MELMDWDTTPKDLRSEDELTLKDYAKKHGHYPAALMKWRELEVYRIRRRHLSREKGESNHKVREVLDTLYDKARDGNTAAAKEYLKHYAGEESAKPTDEADVKLEVSEGEAKSLNEMSAEELEAWLESNSTES